MARKSGELTNDSEKVGFSMSIPKHLKDDFFVYCQKNGVTMTALLLGFMSACLSVDSSSSESTKWKPFIKKSISKLAGVGLYALIFLLAIGG